MNIFSILTPITYWLLAAMWCYVLIFCVKRIIGIQNRNKAFHVLFVVLAIDAFRSLFESAYFGAWRTSRIGLLPEFINDLLGQPQYVFVPKLMNVIAVITIIALLLYRWIPKEIGERENLDDLIKNRTMDLSAANEKLKLEIAEHQKTEEALMRKENEFRNLFSSIRDVIIIADLDRNITDANQPALREQFGYEVDELKGKKTSVLYSNPDDFFHAGREVFDSDGKTVGKLMEVQFRKKDGRSFPSEMLGLKLLDNNGTAVGNIGVIRDITERKVTEEKIYASLKEKEVLLKEIHHRVKNNMSVISSLLSMQSTRVKDPQYLEMFKESQSRIRSMALVHEKLYQSEEFARIDVRDYISSLVQNIKSTYMGENEVSTSINSEAIDLDIDCLVPCGLIINELLTNTFKHAFNGIANPEVSISMVRVGNDKVSLTIEDNGIGLPEGFDSGKSRGLGLQLVNILASQIDGKLEVGSNNGVKFTITFPAQID